MPSLNKVILIGRLTRDPELRYTSSGLAVTSFSIAVDRRFKDQQSGERKTDFFRCTAWRQKAEFVQQYVQKGRLVCVEGAIELNEFTGQDGSRRQSADVQCDNIEILEAGTPRRRRRWRSARWRRLSEPSRRRSDAGGEYFDDEVGAAPARSQNAAPAPASAAASCGSTKCGSGVHKRSAAASTRRTGWTRPGTSTGVSAKRLRF